GAALAERFTDRIEIGSIEQSGQVHDQTCVRLTVQFRACDSLKQRAQQGVIVWECCPDKVPPQLPTGISAPATEDPLAYGLREQVRKFSRTGGLRQFGQQWGGTRPPKTEIRCFFPCKRLSDGVAQPLRQLCHAGGQFLRRGDSFSGLGVFRSIPQATASWH